MKRFILVLIFTLFSGSLFADAIADAKAVLDVLSSYGPNPKVLTNTQMLSIVNKYNEANGFSNPWSEEDNPTEYAAWPTTLERATYFLQALGGDIRGDIGRMAGREYDATVAANRAAAIAAGESEL
jgi:hypothetical protein